MPRRKADITVHGGAGLYLFCGETDKGRQWLDEHLNTEPYQHVSGGIAVEGIRCAMPIAEAAIADGLRVA